MDRTAVHERQFFEFVAANLAESIPAPPKLAFTFSLRKIAAAKKLKKIELKIQYRRITNRINKQTRKIGF